MTMLSLHKKRMMRTAFIGFLAAGLFASMAIPLFAAKDTNGLIGGTLACHAAYKTYAPDAGGSWGGAGGAGWKFKNFDESTSLYIDRIRSYTSDGALYSDYLWNGTYFNDVLGTGILPTDNLGNIAHDNNVLAPFQAFQYNDKLLVNAGVFPAFPNGGHITLVVDWHANSSAFPLTGSVTRHNFVYSLVPEEDSNYVGGMGRSSHQCARIKSVEK